MVTVDQSLVDQSSEDINLTFTKLLSLKSKNENLIVKK